MPTPRRSEFIILHQLGLVQEHHQSHNKSQSVTGTALETVYFPLLVKFDARSFHPLVVFIRTGSVLTRNHEVFTGKRENTNAYCEDCNAPRGA